MAYELVVNEWMGTPDMCAPEGYSAFGYLDLAWRACGGSGDCPETFDDEATARRVAGAVREDKHGVMPRITVRRVGGDEATIYVVRDASGEYVRDASGERRTPASDEAYEFASAAAAESACTRATDRVLGRDDD